MKYKTISVVCMAILLTVPFFMSIESSPTNTRVHQHLEKTEKAPCNHREDTFCSHLPLVSIDTKGQELLLNRNIVNEQINYESNTITGQITVFDNRDTYNHLTNSPQMTTLSQIRYRGYSSLLFDKKSFKLNFVKEDLSENKNELLGMPSHDEWVLNGPFLDKTLIRNYLCFNIAGQIMEDTPEVRFCEVFVDGEYRGVYLAIESVARSRDRVDIESYNDKDRFSSYIVRADRKTNQPEDINTFGEYSYKMPSHTSLEIVYPNINRVSPELLDYIEKDFSKFEKALYSYDYNDRELGYTRYLDEGSFVDYFVINEFFKNYDAGLFSTFFYKDIRGKIHIGPVWDFNNACDNFMDLAHDVTGFDMIHRPRYFMLVKDKRFTDKVIRRYKELRKTVLNEEYLSRYIDDTIDYLGDAINRNYSVWGYSFNPEDLKEVNRLSSIERNPRSYDEAVNQLKSFITARGSWLDEHIELLKQYSHESAVKKFNH